MSKNLKKNVAYFAQIVDQSRQVEPVLFGMALADPFGRLERVHNVRQGGVRVRLVDQIVETLQRRHNWRLETIESAPLFGLLWKDNGSAV